MPEPLKSKFRDTFKEDTNEYEYVNEFLAAVRANWQATENSATRSSVLMVSIAFVFEVIVSSKKAPTATFLGLNLSVTDFVKFALPTLIGYLYYQITGYWIEAGVFMGAHDGALRSRYPGIYANQLAPSLYPSNSLMVGPDRVLVAEDPSSKLATLVLTLSALRPIALALSPPIFLTYAYIQLFQKSSLSNIGLYISLVVSGILVISGGINTYFFVARGSK